MTATFVSRRSVLAAITVCLTLCLTLTGLAQQPPADAIIGTWAAADGSVKLDMQKAGSEFHARLLYGNQVVEADDVTFKQDVKNPDPSLRTRSLKHIVFVLGLRFEDGKWSGGSLYDGSSGRMYKCTVELKDGKMLLRGYLGMSLLGQTRSFHRVQE
jgi:uncharacterized protein (DUF2147 family)